MQVLVTEHLGLTTLGSSQLATEGMIKTKTGMANITELPTKFKRRPGFTIDIG